MNNLGKPVTQRQLRVGEMIKQALGILFIRDEAKLPLSTKEITVTEVRMSPDLKNAKIFVITLGGKDAEEVVSVVIGSPPIRERDTGRAHTQARALGNHLPRLLSTLPFAARPPPTSHCLRRVLRRR